MDDVCSAPTKAPVLMCKYCRRGSFLSSCRRDFRRLTFWTSLCGSLWEDDSELGCLASTSKQRDLTRLGPWRPRCQFWASFGTYSDDASRPAGKEGPRDEIGYRVACHHDHIHNFSLKLIHVVSRRPRTLILIMGGTTRLELQQCVILVACVQPIADFITAEDSVLILLGGYWITVHHHIIRIVSPSSDPHQGLTTKG